jgi:hypothetical protein
MTASNAATPPRNLHGNDRSAASAQTSVRRTPKQIVEGVRQQRRHIMMLDGADPLRGGVAD